MSLQTSAIFVSSVLFIRWELSDWGQICSVTKAPEIHFEFSLWLVLPPI